MTLGNAAAARVRLIVWCTVCRHRVEPDPAEMAERYGADMAVPDWKERLVCAKCGSREIDRYGGHRDPLDARRVNLAPPRPRPLATTFGLLQRDIDQAPDRLRA